MKILYTSDIHTDPNHLDRLLAAAGDLQVDAVIIGGDLIPVWEWTLSASIETQRRWIRDVLFPRLAIFLRKSPSTSFFLDFGNDDLMANRPLLEERAGKYFTLINRQIVALNANLALVGYMFVRPTPFKLKDWEKVDCAHRIGLDDDVLESGVRTETGVERPYKLKLSDGTMEDDLAQLTELLEKPAWQERDFLFVSHCPPVNSALDILSDGRHVGSLAIRHFIEHWGSNGRLRASFHGHIHESPWMSKRVCDRITGVPCFNAGQEAGQLRALFFNARDIENSTHLVKVGDDEQLYKISISELSIHP
jgi:Icc-related predicted phosphoesterase